MHETKVLILSSMVLFAIGYAVMWYVGIFSDLGLHGTIAAVLGTALTTAVGIGLMALIFHSSRTHHDNDAWHTERED